MLVLWFLTLLLAFTTVGEDTSAYSSPSSNNAVILHPEAINKVASWCHTHKHIPVCSLVFSQIPRNSGIHAHSLLSDIPNKRCKALRRNYRLQSTKFTRSFWHTFCQKRSPHKKSPWWSSSIKGTQDAAEHVLRNWHNMNQYEQGNQIVCSYGSKFRTNR